MGCNIAISVYITKLKEDLGTPAPPYLVADTCTHHSVTIQWTPALFPNISYLVQWRYEALQQSIDWEYYESSNILKSNQLTLVGLQPYTNYRFRVAWILLKNITPLFSEESVVISTLPHGTPSTPPKITCLTAVGPTSVSINWEPPIFPNGPVLSYVLYVKEFVSGSVSIKDVSDTSGGFHYMFNNLNPSTTYVISVSTRNNVGEGPLDTKNITTPTRDLFSSSHHPLPYLVFSTKQNVLKQGLRILDESSVLYRSLNSSVSVTGLALHVKKDMFFVSDSNGFIYHVRLKGDKKGSTIIMDSLNSPTTLSVDWLNEKLYVAETDQISRCNFRGEHCEAVLTGLMCQPTDIHADPFNGYLFWAVGSVYRMDLADLDSGPKTLEDAQQIVKDSDIMAFTIDYKNFRLLLPIASKNTIISTALDGSDGMDIRMNSQTSQFTDVQSIASHENLFYWTNGHEIFREEYHKTEDTYYHNPYLLSNGPFSNINIHHPHYQPDPVPLNGVEAVQAIFSEDVAKLRWSKPRLLGGLGKGAWQKWMYEVHLVNHTTGLSIFQKNITKNKHTLHGLVPNTTYSIKIRAYSSGGKGPWSSEFVGHTLKTAESAQKPYVLWSAREGLLKSDVIGDNVMHLIPKIYLNNAHVTGICWFDGQIFLNTNSSLVYVYNMNGNHSLTRLMNVTNAASIAVDWLAPKIYWSSPVQQMISRANLDGSQSEPLPILTMAKQLAIDSPRARIYWATSHNVECSRLNGEEHFVYMKNELFSGKHVMGLTLDFDKNKIYWVVRSHEGSLMYKAGLAMGSVETESEVEYEYIGSLPEDNMRGPLWYFNDRLFWLHEHKGAIISDVIGQNVASLQAPELSGLKSLAIVDSSLHPYPSEFTADAIYVVPNSVVDSSVRVEGTWNSFKITWDPVISINYGALFYEMKVDDGEEIFTQVTDVPVFLYPEMRLLQPYSPIFVAVKAYTYWASSRQTIVLIHSPMSTPSKPLHPRIFITYKETPFSTNRNIQALFRWSPPASPNGIIDGYQITYWIKANGTTEQFHLENTDGSQLQLYINDLKPNTAYYFQVRAYTKVGFGPYSDVVQSKTSEEHPVPQLLLTKTDAVKITDVDTHEQKILSSKVTRPAAVAYLAHEGRIFLVEEDGSLISSLLDGTNITLLRHLSSKVSSLTVDWIGRQLYWVEVDQPQMYSSIWSMDLSNNAFPRLVLNQSGVITSLEAEPLTSSLLWIVKKSTHCELMISSNKGMGVKSFFSQALVPDTNSEVDEHISCNCMPNISRAITVDASNHSHPRVLLADGTGHIWSSDMHGCTCQLLVNASEFKYSGLPPTSLTVDSSRIYWSNETMGKLFSVARDTLHRKDLLPYKINKMPESASYKRHHIASEEIRGIRVIRAIGNHLQPFPSPLCLHPLPYKKKSILESRTSTSMTLRFPPADRPSHCSKISTALNLFTVYYGIVSDDGMLSCKGQGMDSLCMTKETYNSTIVIDGLQPFTNYSFRVSVHNYYSKGKPFLGPVVVYKTEEGAPTPPTNISVQVLTPFRIDVYWQPPVFPNSYPIRYEVRWRTDNFQKSVLYGHYLEEKEDRFVMSIDTNEPGTLHYITVRAYSAGGKFHNDSEEIAVLSYSLPNNLTLSELSSHSLKLWWLSSNDSGITHHTLEYSKVDSFVWHLVTKNEATIPGVLYEFAVYDLNSKTKYNFRLLLTYSSKRVVMEWPQWPHDPYFIFETYGDAPGLPGPPNVRHVNRDVYQVFWTEATGNDGDDLVYELQMRSKDQEFDKWITVYNNSNTQWIVESISENANYEFRVRAINEYGGSNFSFSYEPFFLPQPGAFMDSEEDQVTIIMASAVGLLVLMVISCSVIYMVYRRREKEKKILHDSVTQNQLAPELELATLQELPRHGNFVHQTNALYNLGDLPTDEELLALPRVQRNQIILTKFLGSGAFGEVFEGIVHDLTDDLSPMKIAIKTLRKGATDYEKEEFLKEAKLMSNFKHEHILKLLGVCFDNNPNFIILELMEGGDLLSFLRYNRPSLFQRSSLTLEDLFGICVDVAEGCKYLEDMHFVHRDLAARNCLVSSFDRQHRIVKIGDFGLARDIYKNDYYRKEGEGLLPVRWMAPESLVYGIFTSQSDVWAFGVLLWEVMTLGQQPYPARTNVEVLHFVRAGGRLDKPENCPEDLHEVMVNCWSYDPEGRPSFSYCLNALQELRQKSLFSPTILSAVQNENYLSPSISGGYIVANTEMNNAVTKNESELEADRFSIQSDPGISIGMRELTTPAMKRSASLTHQSYFGEHPNHSVCLPPEGVPVCNGLHFSQNYNKYLELLADQEDEDGYEIPLRAIVNHRNSSVRQSQGSNHFPTPVQEYHNAEDSEILPKPILAPFYAQVYGGAIVPFETDKSLESSCSDPIVDDEMFQDLRSASVDSLATKKLFEESSPTPSCQFSNSSSPSAMDKENDGSDCRTSSENDQWSLSTASTVPCDLYSAHTSQRNSATSTLSSETELNLNHISTSSWC